MDVSAQARPDLRTSFSKILLGIVFSLSATLGNANTARSQSGYPVLDPVVVTGTRMPHPLSQNGHAFCIISREEIENSGADNVSDLLEFVSGTDVRQRGGHGVQADVSIRAGSYEQTLILIDGVQMADPQTGHHNMDLPVTPDDIERIEVLKGPAARAYGPNAVAGVINVITRQAHTTRASGALGMGDHAYYRISAQGSVSGRSATAGISASRRRSTGYLSDHPTDFDIKTLFYKTHFGRSEGNSGLTFGVVDKDFGAYGFYSDTYPEQREATRTLLAEGRSQMRAGDWRIEPRLFWRHHDDDFKIRIGDPWNENSHQSNVYGAQCLTRGRTRLGHIALGASLTHETLKSSNLGSRHRNREELFFEHRFGPLGCFNAGVGTSAAHDSRRGWRLCPGADLNVTIAPGLNGFVSAERAYRIPTLTELYYSSPANQGNPDLGPEKSWTYETGLRWMARGFSADSAAFFRKEQDVIDWNRPSAGEPWKARNIPSGTTRGIEAGVSVYSERFFALARPASFRVSYTYLDTARHTGGLQSKYALDHLRHQLLGSLTTRWRSWFKSTIKLRYGERLIGDSFFLVDISAGFQVGKLECFLEADNVFDEEYVDGGFAPMPGRWIILGIRMTTDTMSP